MEKLGTVEITQSKLDGFIKVIKELGFPIAIASFLLYKGTGYVERVLDANDKIIVTMGELEDSRDKLVDYVDEIRSFNEDIKDSLETLNEFLLNK